ncbi:MAG: hypothetical protein IKS87_06905 [Lachnospiraceae bacterium]|nr:hypothetical protein [Lachnospiraceae bacterium]
MDNGYYRNEALQIVSDLFEEFSKEEMKLKVKYDNNCSKLEEMDQQIRLLSRSEDMEMRVFSPRKHISSENDKVVTLKREREELERSNRETERDYRYYSKRAEKLRYLLDLLERNEGVFLDNTVGDFAADPKTVEATSPVAADSVSVEDLKKLEKRLDSCYHFVDTDAQRAKLEMKNILIMVTDLIGNEK